MREEPKKKEVENSLVGCVGCGCVIPFLLLILLILIFNFSTKQLTKERIAIQEKISKQVDEAVDLFEGGNLPLAKRKLKSALSEYWDNKGIGVEFPLSKLENLPTLYAFYKKELKELEEWEEYCEYIEKNKWVIYKRVDDLLHDPNLPSGIAAEEAVFRRVAREFGISVEEVKRICVEGFAEWLEETQGRDYEEWLREKLR